ncbi:transposase [Streptomyces luteolus]|uniref:Transposase n=1 Tax=Streptomyces luteolus TaxID=3043615 RepID=A0ABT6SUD2_9ACTN|nr:transposase [Streptomyces sp. B-S-A12]MDI3419186.1 transposase [Streptomyces sp. B-S-A12]
MEALADRLVPDELWAVAEPLMPAPRPRSQGGGRSAADRRQVLVAVVYVLTSGCAWQLLPPAFGVTVPTAHRWFSRWTRAGLWRELRAATAADPALAAWTRALHECAERRVYARGIDG